MRAIFFLLWVFATADCFKVNRITMTTQTTVLPIAKARLKLITFNILAPCYKRIRSEESSLKFFESDREDLYMPRCDAICDEVSLSCVRCSILILYHTYPSIHSLKPLYSKL